MKILIIGILSAMSLSSLAGTVAPSPHESINVSTDAIPEGAAGIIVDAACYGTNNRGTTNPLSPSSRIVLYLSNATEQLLVDFPSSIIASRGSSTDENCGITKISNNSLRTQSGNTTVSTVLSSSSSGGAALVDALSISNLDKFNQRKSIACRSFPINYAADFAIENITSYYAIQVFNSVVSPQSFYGYNGIMDRGAKVSIKVNSVSTGYESDSKFLSISAAFPGQDGFCGGYHSPLMFFFKEAFPVFSGTSTLLKGKDKPTSWVEENHEGYFLVKLKKAGDEITTDKLFGDNSKEKNGFEVLMKLDSNNDKVLDKKDKAFKNLYLWKDANGNSKNDKGEAVKLSDLKVESIDLKYNDGYHLDKGVAVFKGRSTFKFTGDDKKSHDGEIFDIFFNNK